MPISKSVNPTSPNSPNALKIWMLAARPKTLAASVAPVLIGTAMAYQYGSWNAQVFLLTLATTLLIQIGTNFCNDYFDFVKGADTPERLGPTRATQSGLISPVNMQRAYMFIFGVSAVLGVVLVWRGGWPILLIGIASIASGILYTAGPASLAYLGLGELFVLIFFGPVAVAGTYYLQTLHFDLTTMIAGLSTGLWSVAILCVNNLRDRQQDRKAQKRTLAVRFGKAFAKWEYVFAVTLALCVPIYLWQNWGFPPRVLWSSGVGLLVVSVAKTIFTYNDPQALNDVLAKTGQMLLLFSVIFSLSLI